jgi:hypothetical protein
MTTVARAAEIMDREFPGWYRKIDLSDFNLFDPRKCVLWHGTGNFGISFIHLHHKYEEVRSDGHLFSARRHEPAWIHEITWRREQDTKMPDTELHRDWTESVKKAVGTLVGAFVAFLLR